MNSDEPKIQEEPTSTKQEHSHEGHDHEGHDHAGHDHEGHDHAVHAHDEMPPLENQGNF